MARLIYVVDATAISDLFLSGSPVQHRITAAKSAGHRLLLSQSTFYEVLRGLLKVQATRKLAVFQNQLVPLFEWTVITDEDWEQAAQLWAESTRQGRQLSDGDLLLAAVALRLDAVIITSDADFAILPVKLENWRDPKGSSQ
jgi:tRNA(fMet)-specific endonuclease VapC